MFYKPTPTKGAPTTIMKKAITIADDPVFSRTKEMIPNAKIEPNFQETNPSVAWAIERIFQDRKEVLNDKVPIEEPLEINVNGRTVAILMRMPGMEKELAAGFCLSEGYIRRVQDILLIHHCGLGEPTPALPENTGNESGSRNRVEIRVKEGALVLAKNEEAARLIRSGCGAADISPLAEALPHLSPHFSVEPSVILRLGKTMRNLQRVYHETGGTHSAVVFDASGKPLQVAEDIGRHNAVDKVVGYCALHKIQLEDKILPTSGRASYEMAIKAIHMKIPIIAAISAPTSLALQTAQECRLTIIGYLRRIRMNVYTHPYRLRKN